MFHSSRSLDSLQLCCPKSEIICPVCRTPIYTQSGGGVFIAYLPRYGC